MNLDIKVTGERVKVTTYRSWAQPPETETHTVAQVALDGSPALVAATLHALADIIDPTGAAL